MNKEILEKFKDLCSKEISLSEVCKTLERKPYEALSLINELRTYGINIVTKVFDDDVYMFNNGERELSENCTEKREVFKLTQTGPVVPVRTTSFSFLYKHKISHNPWLNTMPLLSSYVR